MVLDVYITSFFDLVFFGLFVAIRKESHSQDKVLKSLLARAHVSLLTWGHSSRDHEESGVHLS